MILFKKQALLQAYLQAEGRPTLGFVPTMGALHAGHLSLVAMSAAANERTVVSIFVNPTQFNNADDLAKYPRTLAADITVLMPYSESLILYAPDAEDIYPEGMAEPDAIHLNNLDALWEGEHRPGHFAGVAQVVERLLRAVQPGHLYMGQKDYQQCMVVAELIRQRFAGLSLHIGPTIREENGLAMSSRNTRLQPQDLEKATVLFREMKKLNQLANEGALEKEDAMQEALARAKNQILEAGFSGIDYLAICEPQFLQPLNKANKNAASVTIVAATIAGVRLIDNLLRQPTV